MPTWLSRITMFVSSMAPLLFVFALLDTFGNTVATWACVALAVAAIGAHAVLLWSLANDHLGSASKRRSQSIEHAEERGGDVMAYVATYLIPFAGFTAYDWRSAAALGLFFIVVGALYVRSGLYAINPCLSIVGFHLYRTEVALADGRTRPTNLLVRARIPPGPVTIDGHQFGPDLIIAFGKDFQLGHRR